MKNKSLTCNVPERRFPEFLDEPEWKEKAFGKLIKINSGKGFKASEYSNTGLRLLQIENVGYGSVKWANNTVFLPKNYLHEYPELVLKNGDIVLALNRPVTNNELKIARLIKDDELSILYQRVGKLQLLSDFLVEEFIFQLSKNFIKNFVLKQSIGSDQPFISLKDLYNQKLIIPDTLEQQKIADCLSSIDNLITAQSKKVEALKEHKKGLMQQLFPTDGEKVPKLRFPEFLNDVEWEEKKLKSILLDYKLGGNYSNSAVKNEYPLIKMGNIGRGDISLNKIEYIDKIDEVDELDKIKYGDLFLNTRNTLELVGKVAIWKNELPNAYYNSNLMWMKFDNNFFMNYRLNSFQGVQALRSIATGTTSVAAIYTKDLLSLKLFIPSKEEQQKIADCLSSIDNLITAQSKKVETLKEHKKGLMQQLFPSAKES